MNELPTVFQSQGRWLAGIIHQAENIAEEAREGVIIVVGGPQTRVGSHRQFVLLARYLATQGICVLRFDFAGIGDSEGELSNFLTAPQDIEAATAQFVKCCPTLNNITLWGLCDGASAILLYLSQQQSAYINRVILANPWVEQTQSKAKTMLKYYYLRRLLSASLWRKIFSGKLSISSTVKGLFGTLSKLFSRGQLNISLEDNVDWSIFNNDNFVLYMKQGLKNFNGKGHLILSGQDLVALEFTQLLGDDPEWRQLISEKFGERLDLKSSNHTFASAKWRQRVETFTLDQIR